MQIRPLALLCSLFFVSCGYRHEGIESCHEVYTVSVPYVSGDGLGLLTNALIRELSSSGNFRYVRDCGNLILRVSIVSDHSDRIGYRYNQDGLDPHLERNLIGIENRRTLCAEVTLLDGATEEVLFGPTQISSDVEFDYDDPNSIRDLATVQPNGVRESTLVFSLGQLDSEGSASTAATPLLHRNLAQKIVQGLLAID